MHGMSSNYPHIAGKKKTDHAPFVRESAAENIQNFLARSRGHEIES